MEENLVIVESPAKAKTIEKFLGSKFSVTSSFGHIRDLSKKNLGIDIQNNFKPDYIISDDKKKVVTELKKRAKEAKMVWLASDEDREGEAIAWHLYDVLKLNEKNTKRIVFNEITKPAILKAIDNPRMIDRNLVDAQQARRILDRLVGFELSPVLWKKVKPSLSAGRVQSVAVRLIVEREREIMNFKTTSSYKVSARFIVTGKDNKKSELVADLPKRFKTKKETIEFLEKCREASFKVVDINTRPSRKSPAPPFTTSTLQQEASRKLGFSVSQTMSVAQRLYEAGRITYMRTDSVNLSDTIINNTKKVITADYGAKYSNSRQFKTKSKGAQEAHEAIRPTYIDKPTVPGNNQEKKLYDLIWKRTIASQMSDAELEKTTATISISNQKEQFVANGEVLKFDGFLKVYIESTDEEQDENVKSSLLPPLSLDQPLDMKEISATERFTHHPPRYTEASLVKKLEELGIGRPSTYAPTISTIQNRGYVVREDRPGEERKYVKLVLANEKINETSLTETTGAEKAKLFPNDIGMIVNDFLVEHFDDIIDFNFTAKVEKEFDEIAEGKKDWTKMIDRFYNPFHQRVEETLEQAERNKGERILGNDPKTGKVISVKIGRYGPMVQMGEATDEEKPRFAGLQKGQHLETITLEEALDLFKLPRTIGTYEDSDVAIGVGRFGPYVRHKSKFYSLKKGVDDPMTIELDRAIELIEEKRERDRNKIIKTFPEDEKLEVLNGRWGPYISYDKGNYKIPKDKEASSLSYKECMEIVSKGKPSGKRKKKKK
ncbi:MAG TPA: type I DNA topoisomerase [Bacteroidales bacterium]|nr:type I DNA topoisomerase [Bacteroidales bacterium]